MKTLKLVFFFLFLSFATVILFPGCGNELESYDPVWEAGEYYPLKVGNTWIYQVDSVVYDNAGLKVRSSSNKVRETITESFEDNEGNQIYRIERSKLREIENSWLLTDIWSASIDDKAAYRTEENLRFAKLNFPINEGRSWDGNAFIDEDIVIKVAGEPIRVYQNWGTYTYSSAGQAETFGELSFESVATVEQVDLEDLITRRYSVEKYAKNVGLVYRNMIILNTQKFESSDTWENKAEEGFILEQTLLEFIEG